MSNLVKHAKTELKMAGLLNKKSVYDGMLGKAVLELMKVFSKQGHSGMSAPMVASLFNKLANYETLGPVTGSEEEWMDVSKYGGEIMYQNKRCSALFKNSNDEKAYYLDAIVWQGEEEGDVFTGSIEGVSSMQYVKFPFMPKTFYINVIREKYDKNNIRHHNKEDIRDIDDETYIYFIKDKEKLNEVFKYYNPYSK